MELEKTAEVFSYLRKHNIAETKEQTGVRTSPTSQVRLWM